MKNFFEGPNFKYLLLAMTVIIIMLIWKDMPPKCSSFSIKIEGTEFNMDNFESCNFEQLKQLVDTVFKEGAYNVFKQTKKILKEQTALSDEQAINIVLNRVEQVKNKTVKNKIDVRRNR